MSAQLTHPWLSEDEPDPCHSTPQLLVRVLKTPKAMQGFTSPLLPSVPPLKALGDSGPPDVQVKCQQLLRRGSAWLQGSWVYLVSMGGGAGGVSDVPGRQDERLALKLNESPDEVRQVMAGGLVGSGAWACDRVAIRAVTAVAGTVELLGGSCGSM